MFSDAAHQDHGFAGLATSDRASYTKALHAIVGPSEEDLLQPYLAERCRGLCIQLLCVLLVSDDPPSVRPARSTRTSIAGSVKKLKKREKLIDADTTYGHNVPAK